MASRTLYVEGNQSFLCGNARSSANELVHNSFILIHYIIEMCWKMHLCGSKVGGNVDRPPHILITVDAVSSCGHSLRTKDKKLINLSEQAKI